MLFRSVVNMRLINEEPCEYQCSKKKEFLRNILFPFHLFNQTKIEETATGLELKTFLNTFSEFYND